MAINFVQGQVAQGDPNPGGPTALSNSKDKRVKVVKLTSANFSTTNVDTLVAVLPADSTILSIDSYVKTQLAGGSISAATFSIGSSSGGTQYVSASTNAFGVAGTSAPVSPVQGIMQNYALPLGSDLQIFVRGTATTGNPTSGELYLIISYVR
tara:strand:- start:1292 stop:1750 length:459 start_codon:yes stop_codon:yes gene_type:complete